MQFLTVFIGKENTDPSGHCEEDGQSNLSASTNIILTRERLLRASQ